MSAGQQRPHVQDSSLAPCSKVDMQSSLDTNVTRADQLTMMLMMMIAAARGFTAILSQSALKNFPAKAVEIRTPQSHITVVQLPCCLVLLLMLEILEICWQKSHLDLCEKLLRIVRPS